MKRLVKETDDPHVESNPIPRHLNMQFLSLESKDNSSSDIVRLKSHKKKAPLATIPNLPAATGIAYTTENVKKGFLYNGQIDDKHCSVPCIDNLIHTFCGDVDGTCLDNKQKIIE